MPLGFGCEAQYPVATFRIQQASTVAPVVVTATNPDSFIAKIVLARCIGAVASVKATSSSFAASCSSSVAIAFVRLRSVFATSSSAVATTNQILKVAAITSASLVATTFAVASTVLLGATSATALVKQASKAASVMVMTATHAGRLFNSTIAILCASQIQAIKAVAKNTIPVISVVSSARVFNLGLKVIAITVVTLTMRLVFMPAKLLSVVATGSVAFVRSVFSSLYVSCVTVTSNYTGRRFYLFVISNSSTFSFKATTRTIATTPVLSAVRASVFVGHLIATVCASIARLANRSLKAISVSSITATSLSRTALKMLASINLATSVLMSRSAIKRVSAFTSSASVTGRFVWHTVTASVAPTLVALRGTLKSVAVSAVTDVNRLSVSRKVISISVATIVAAVRSFGKAITVICSTVTVAVWTRFVVLAIVSATSAAKTTLAAKRVLIDVLTSVSFGSRPIAKIVSVGVRGGVRVTKSIAKIFQIVVYSLAGVVATYIKKPFQYSARVVLPGGPARVVSVPIRWIVSKLTPPPGE